MKRRSIRLRLTAWYAGSILLILLAGTIAGRRLVSVSLEEEFSRSLDASIGLVQGFFRVEVAEYHGLEPTLAHIAGELVIPDRRVDFVRPDASVFVSPVPPSPVAAAALRVPADAAADPRWVVIEGPLDRELAPGWRIRVTASRASLIRQRERVDRTALLAVPLAFVLALVAGWVLTGRNLRPVAAMADAADRISAAAGGRLPVAVPDDELGRLGTRFNAVLDRLDAALARQRRFLADAAHELRTPIARARGAADLALSGAAGTGDREALVRTQHELETMSHLVNELLELARTEVAVAPPAREVVFLDDLATEAARAFDPLARARRQRIELEVPDEVPVRGDAAALQRLVGILLDNALRYSADGGVVRVRARRVDGAAELDVADDGIGIAPDERARLFERFFRGARARQAAPDGSGLGLAIAQAIAQRHGATIAFDHGVASGTRVVVRFG